MDMSRKDPDHLEATTLEGMTVRKIGRGLYECSSQSNAKTTYHLDILANGGLGECDCWDFMSRRWPRWKSVRQPYDSFRCKHIRRVRNFVLDAILKPHVDLESGKTKTAKAH